MSTDAAHEFCEPNIITFRAPPDLAEAAKEAARSEMISTSAYVRRALRQVLRADGFTPRGELVRAA